MASRLPNYLRTFRKRANYSQDEMAFLLGTSCGSRISRYERYKRFPGPETVLAYQIIFTASPKELFGGVYERIERDVGQRARKLIARVEARDLTPSTRQKLSALRALREKNK